MNARALLAWLPLERFRNPPPVVAVVSLHGVIGRIGFLRQGLSMSGLAATLERAFTLKGAKAVAIIVNSPGGAPVQAALIARRIRALAEEHKLPVYAFAEDVAASGGYWLLTAGDEIYADESSIIGSIGVVAAGFGFPEALKRLGIERRIYTAGAHKAALDPFQPERPEEVEHLKQLQAEVHDTFCRQVRERRGTRLKVPAGEVFTGRFWAGRAAVELGLIDGLGDVRSVLRAKFGTRVRLRLIGTRPPWWRRKLGLQSVQLYSSGEDLPDRLLASVEERLLWSRFGL